MEISIAGSHKSHKKKEFSICVKNLCTCAFLHISHKTRFAQWNNSLKTWRILTMSYFADITPFTKYLNNSHKSQLHNANFAPSQQKEGQTKSRYFLITQCKHHITHEPLHPFLVVLYVSQTHSLHSFHNHSSLNFHFRFHFH